jgi:hypothetical protein
MALLGKGIVMTEEHDHHGHHEEHGEQHQNESRDHHQLHVTVHYIAAAHPFKDEHADRHETVGHLKSRVLSAFGLAEGTQGDGATATYTLYHGKTPLENMSETLGPVAGEHKKLDLKLSQQLTQGSRY